MGEPTAERCNRYVLRFSRGRSYQRQSSSHIVVDRAMGCGHSAWAAPNFLPSSVNENFKGCHKNHHWYNDIRNEGPVEITIRSNLPLFHPPSRSSFLSLFFFFLLFIRYRVSGCTSGDRSSAQIVTY